MILFDRVGRANIRVRAWEIWPEHPSHVYFGAFLAEYFQNNYLVKGSRAAPANLHPLKFDNLMMNPVRIFDAILREVDEPTASVEIVEHFDPRADRESAPVEAMRPSQCKPHELAALISNAPYLLMPYLAPRMTIEDLAEAAREPRPSVRGAQIDAALTEIPPAARLLIAMRSKRVKTSPSTYTRRSAGS